MAQWLPKQACRYLGFIVNAAEQKFEFPEEQKRDLITLIEETVDSPTVSNRQLAKVAETLIVAAPAIQLAPLFARAVYQAMTGKSDWDELYPSMRRRSILHDLCVICVHISTGDSRVSTVCMVFAWPGILI